MPILGSAFYYFPAPNPENPKRFVVTQSGFDDIEYLTTALDVGLYLARLFGKCTKNGTIDVDWIVKVEKQAEKLKLFEEISDQFTGISVQRIGF